jgi:nucleoside-diphosphate-sugar epimerase
MSPSSPSRFRSILVTGRSGYVGSALVPALLERGDPVKIE